METILVDKFERLDGYNIIVQVGECRPKMERIFHENKTGILCNDLESYVDFETAIEVEFD